MPEAFIYIKPASGDPLVKLAGGVSSHGVVIASRYDQRRAAYLRKLVSRVETQYRKSISQEPFITLGLRESGKKRKKFSVLLKILFRIHLLRCIRHKSRMVAPVSHFQPAFYGSRNNSSGIVRSNSQYEFIDAIRISDSHALRDHSSLGHSKNAGFPDPQFIHGCDLIIRHVFYGISLRHVVLPAEHVYGIVIEEFSI